MATALSNHEQMSVDEIAECRLPGRADYQPFITAKRLQKDLVWVPDDFDETLRIAIHMTRLNLSQCATMPTYITVRILGGSKT